MEGLGTCEEKGFIEFSEKQWWAFGFNFKQRPATPTLSKQNPGNIKKRIDPGHLMDFPADQMNGLRGRIQ